MKTTMSFSGARNDRKSSGIIFSSSGRLNEAITMVVKKVKDRLYYADEDTLVYDEETGHLRVGRGPNILMESVSGVKVVDSIEDMPSKGRIDTLYVCLDDLSTHVWDGDHNAYAPVTRGINEKRDHPVVIVDSQSSLPDIGDKDHVYVTRDGQIYVYDIERQEYSLVAGEEVYTKEEADEKFATKEELRESINDILIADYTDIKDVFTITYAIDSPSFILSNTPIGNDVKLFINGVLYTNSPSETNYTYDPDTKKVTWVNNSEETNGFKLESAMIVIEYRAKSQ